MYLSWVGVRSHPQAQVGIPESDAGPRMELTLDHPDGSHWRQKTKTGNSPLYQKQVTLGTMALHAFGKEKKGTSRPSPSLTGHVVTRPAIRVGRPGVGVVIPRVGHVRPGVPPSLGGRG